MKINNLEVRYTLLYLNKIVGELQYLISYLSETDSPDKCLILLITRLIDSIALEIKFINEVYKDEV